MIILRSPKRVLLFEEVSGCHIYEYEMNKNRKKNELEKTGYECRVIGRRKGDESSDVHYFGFNEDKTGAVDFLERIQEYIYMSNKEQGIIGDIIKRGDNG